MKTTIHFILLSRRGISAQFGLYDTEHRAKYKIKLNDRSQMIRMSDDGSFDTTDRRSWMGSMRMVDEMKFFKNGKEIDPSRHTSAFYVGEHETGRWEHDHDFILKTRMNNERVSNIPYDTEGWKDYIESYN